MLRGMGVESCHSQDPLCGINSCAHCRAIRLAAVSTGMLFAPIAMYHRSVLGLVCPEPVEGPGRLGPVATNLVLVPQICHQYQTSNATFS